MRERVLQLNGTFEFDSAPGRGTTSESGSSFSTRVVSLLQAARASTGQDHSSDRLCDAPFWGAAQRIFLDDLPRLPRIDSSKL